MIQGQTLTGIADAIRAQLGTEQQYTPESMAAAIGSIQGGTTEVGSLIDGSINGDLLFTVSSIKSYGVSYINNPFKLKFPDCKRVEYNGIYQNTGLTWIYFGKVTTIGNASLAGNKNMTAVVIKSSAVPTLGDRVFVSTPIESGTGYVYVQDELVEQYKVATNWVVYADQIKGLSELPAEVQEWLDQQGGTSA